MKKHKSKIFLGIAASAFISFLFLSPSNHIAENKTASLFISPKEGEFLLDKDFSASVNVDAKFSINAAEAVLNFDSEILDVASISKEGSIFSLWLQEPIFSNASGTIEFAGGVPNGYEGKGRLFSITFRPKRAENAGVEFSNASVLANDGEGTEILKDKTGAIYSIRKAEISSPDLNNDGRVTTQDISILLSHWGDKNNPKYESKYDINKDGKIDLSDISILLSKMK